MGRKKKPGREDTTKPLQNPSKDIDEIFAEKSVRKAGGKTTLIGIPTSTTPPPQAVEKTAGDNLATIQKKIQVAKMKELPLAIGSVADDDFADIRGTRKRIPFCYHSELQVSERRMA
jgi:hypothetical protein